MIHKVNKHKVSKPVTHKVNKHKGSKPVTPKVNKHKASKPVKSKHKLTNQPEAGRMEKAVPFAPMHGVQVKSAG